jgi:hypothetical protein
MSDSNDEFTPVTAKTKPSRDYGSKQQVRMEIMLDPEAGRVNIAGVLSELVKRATAALSPIRFFDVLGTPFCTTTVPAGKEFITRLAVEKIEFGNTRKVALGLLVQSTLSLNEIKTTIGTPWLQQQKIFLRHQRMPFSHGTDLFLIGYLVQEHPSTANYDALEQSISAKWFDPEQEQDSSLDDDSADNEGKDYKDLVRALVHQKTIVDNKLMIPITSERSVLKVKAPGRKQFDVPILSIYVPHKYREAATRLNDFAINDLEDLSIVPFSLSKNHPEQFYYHMTKHAEFMHEHRNITIISANHNNADNLSIEYPDPAHPNSDKINVSVVGTDKYPKVCEWLDRILARFPYHPTRLVPTRSSGPSNKSSVFPNKAISKGRTDKYTNKFAIPSDELRLTFDPCNTSSLRRRGPKGPNVWANGPPPMEVYYDPTERIEFPPLPSQVISILSSENHGGYDRSNIRLSTLGAGTVPSTTVRNSYTTSQNEPVTTGIAHHATHSIPIGNNLPVQPVVPIPDIDAIIAAAVAKSNAKLSADLKNTQEKFAILENEIAELHQTIAENAQKVAAVTSKATIAALTGPESPFVTKADNIRNQEQHVQTQVQIGNTLLHTLTTIMNHQSNESQSPGSVTQNPLTPLRKHTKIPKHDHTGPNTAYMDDSTSPTSPADSTMTPVTITTADDGMAVDGVGED